MTNKDLTKIREEKNLSKGDFAKLLGITPMLLGRYEKGSVAIPETIAEKLQAAAVIAVTDRTTRDRISEDNRRIGGWKEGFDPFYGAPVILIVIGNKEVPTHVYDGSLVMGNLMLAAHSLGLGSIWIHRAKEEMEMDSYKDLLKELGIEGDWEGIGHCAIGYMDQDQPKAVERKENRVFWVE